MSSLFGEVWFWSLAAFLVGALLTLVLLVRPERRRVKQLERRDQEQRRRQAAAQQAAASSATGLAEPSRREADWPGAPEAPEAGEAFEPQPRTEWLERESLPQRSYPDDLRIEEYPETDDGYAEGREDLADEDFAEDFAADDYPADYPEEVGRPAALDQPTTVQPAVTDDVAEQPTGLFEPPAEPPLPSGDIADRLGAAEPETAGAGFGALDDLDDAVPSSRTEALPPRVRPEESLPTQRVEPTAPEWPDDGTQSLAPIEEEFTRRVKPRSPAERQPPAPATADAPAATEAESGYFDDEQPTAAVGPDGQLPDIEPEFDPDTGLPKRTRGASTRIRGGFEPPKPIQPSVRPIARRTPSDTTVATGGSLFDPTPAAGIPMGAGHQAPPARSVAEQQRQVPPGPFGPGSAMPLPGGSRPDPSFTVKGSVTALRYCPETSPRFGEMVAEVWFASVADAERVGFRPLG